MSRPLRSTRRARWLAGGEVERGVGTRGNALGTEQFECDAVTGWAAGEEAWVIHHETTAAANLISKTDSRYTGSNVPGKPRRVLSYTGGVGDYRQRTQEAAANGYRDFSMR